MLIEPAGPFAAIRVALRKARIAAVAIALFLYWSIHFAIEGLWTPAVRILNYLFEGVAILDIPYFAHPATLADRILAIQTIHYLYAAAVSAIAAWILARWTYGFGPIQSLVKCMRDFKGETNA